MSAFYGFQRKLNKRSALASPTSSFSQHSQPFAPLPTTSEPMPIEETSCSKHVPHLGHSFTTIPLFPQVQRKAVTPSPLQNERQLQLHIQAARSSGYHIDKQVQRRLEQGIGANLSHVRVHTDNNADYLARSMNALAFTSGKDIFFRSGAYRPKSSQGLHLLAHEAAHVVQQMSGPVTGVRIARDVSISDPKDRFEQAAERVADHFEQASGQATGQLMETSISPNNIFIQRVTVPHTHTEKDAKEFVRHKAYAKRPMQSSGNQERLGECQACERVEPFSRLQVDHIVPENFLRSLLALYGVNQKLGEEIAKELQLDWTARTEIDVSKVSHSESWREKYESYELSDPKGFGGYVYEVLYDTENLWLLCPDCNGKQAKTDKLLEVDYDALNDWYAKQKKPVKTTAMQYLAKWIGTNYYWNPAEAEQQIDQPDSPGYATPEEMIL